MVKGNRLGSGVIIAVDSEFGSELQGSGPWWDRVRTPETTPVKEETPGKESMIQISYSGILAKRGAKDVYVHYGYGADWTGLTTLPMVRIRPGHWIISIFAMMTEDIRFCFVDSDGNWDNNDGQDWSFHPGKGTQRKKTREHMI